MSEERSNDSVKDWWSARPMTYGTSHGEASYKMATGEVEAVSLGTREFFERLDQEFYGWNTPLHSTVGFFGKIFPYDAYRGGRVLEIGCGLGTMAMNWVRHGARVTAADLNPVAVAQTAERFRLFGLTGSIAQTDANDLTFKNDTFDYVYSWGVLHHSPNLPRSIAELFRVLRPGGRFGVMLYNRSSIRYHYIIRYVEGFLHGESRFLSPLALASRYTDAGESDGNPHTWPVTRREMTALFAPRAHRLTMETFGEELESTLDFMLPALGKRLPRSVRQVWAKRWGWSLWISGTKKET